MYTIRFTDSTYLTVKDAPVLFPVSGLIKAAKESSRSAADLRHREPIPLIIKEEKFTHLV